MTVEEAYEKASEEYKHIPFGPKWMALIGRRACELYGEAKWKEACEEQIKTSCASLGFRSEIFIYPQDYTKICEHISKVKPDFKP